MAHHDPSEEIESSHRRAWGRTAIAPAALVLLVVLLALILAGSTRQACLFFAAWAIFVAPGFGLARNRFPGLEGLFVGAALGYLASSLLASLLYRWGGLGAPSLAMGCLVMAGGLWLAGRRGSPVARNGEPSHDGRWLVASLALVVVMVALPFAKVGAETAGGIAYRAYFSADLMTHLSVVAELQKGDVPPQNPFYRGEGLGYYWLFFLFPAVVGRWIGNQEALLLTDLMGVLLFGGLAFYAARRVARSPRWGFLGVAAGVGAASFEGVATLAWATAVGRRWSVFQDMNVDAFSRWVLELTSLDGLHRSLLYTPQHLFSYSLLLIFLILVLHREELRTGDAALLGLLLGGMAGTSIVTPMLAGPWWLAWEGLRAVRGGSGKPRVRDLAIVVGIATGLLAWYFELGFFGQAGAALTFRPFHGAEIPAIVLLECGGVFLISLPALGVPRCRPLWGLASLALIAVLILDVRGYEGVWMAWRAGSVLLLVLLLLATVGAHRWPASVLVALFVTGAPTVALDVFNAQDLENRRLSAGGFRWTTLVTQPEVEALAWIRRETPRDAVIQWDVRARNPGEWALIPAVGERRMAVGFPIFLLELRKYRARERRQIRPIFVSPDPREAHRLAVEAGIDYLVVGLAELDVRGGRVRKLWEAPDLFRIRHASPDVTVFEVVGS